MNYTASRPSTHVSALKTPALVVYKARLLKVRQHRWRTPSGGATCASGGYPAEERHELAAVADAEGPGVLPRVEGLELAEHALVEADGARPALEF